VCEKLLDEGYTADVKRDVEAAAEVVVEGID
jgi:hypothetical protein